MPPINHPFPIPTQTQSTSNGPSWFLPATTAPPAPPSSTAQSLSQPTSRSTSLSSLSSQSFPHSPRVHVNVSLPSSTGYGVIGDKKPLRRFGAGWHSSSTASTDSREDEGEEDRLEVLGDLPSTPPMIADLLDASNITPVAPKRIRTPSLPILPSQETVQRSTPFLTQHGNQLSYSALQNFDQLSLNAYPYTPPATHDPYFSSLPAPTSEYPFDRQPAPYQARAASGMPVLRNHQSVPDLDKTQRRRAGVRFSDELVQYDDGDAGAMLRSKLGSRSMMSLSGPPVAVGKKRNVLIHDIPPQITEHGLRIYADVFGTVTSMRVINEDGDQPGHQQCDMPRHAYVMFETHEQAAAFFSAMTEQGLQCEYAKEDWQTEYRAREDPTSSNVYVVGLPLEWGKDEVEDYMTQFGRVASLRLLEDKDGNRRGPVLVRFDSRPQAERAIKILNGQTHSGTGERLQARIADSDGQKDFKKLRSTSADLILDDRNGRSQGDEADNVSYLLTIREKYLRRLELLDAQISSADQSRQMGSQPIPTGTQSPFAYGQAWRQRHLSGLETFTPWTGHSHSQSPSAYRYDNTYAYPSYPSNNLSPLTSRSASRIEMGLQHARSTPDLGQARSDSAAKLLWPN